MTVQRRSRRDSWKQSDFGPVSVPTMITREEQKYLHWLTRWHWRGDGVVLEVGPWLGGSTICLAAGIAASEHREKISKPLYVVDNFRWRPFMASRASLPILPDQSFEPFFRRYTARFEELIVVQQASLPDDDLPQDRDASQVRDVAPPIASRFRWKSEKPIEILFVDGAKSWDGLLHLLKEVSSDLIERKTLLVFQDYKYWGAYWVPMILETLSNQLEIAHNVEDGGTVAFRLSSKLTAEILCTVPTSNELTVEHGQILIEKAQHRLLELEDRLGVAVLKAASVRFYGNRGFWEKAQRSFRAAERTWPLFEDDTQLELCRDWMRIHFGSPVPPTIRTFLRCKLKALAAVMSLVRRS